MAARLSLVVAAFSVSLIAPAFAPRASAQVASVQVPPAVENSRFQFVGQIVADGVQVQSGPGENYYATCKLDRGTEVTVVGIKFDWLKIVPPRDSFSVISRQFVQRATDNRDMGVVSGNNVNVRAGSSLVPVKNTVQCQLSSGAQVHIRGEQDEYYVIDPPPEAYLYVHQRFVKPIRQINARPIAQGAPTTRPVTYASAQGPTTRPAGGSAEVRATQPQQVDRAAEAVAAFQRLEVDAANADAMPWPDRPYPQLIQAYSELVKAGTLPQNQQQLAEARLASLNIKNGARNEYIGLMKEMDATNQRIAQIRSERQVTEQKIAAGPSLFTAVGQFQASSVQAGNSPLYRLTDPANGRTICYVRSSDTATGGLIDKFVGVRGDLATDPQLTLKVITATEITSVDPAKVNHGIAAELVPPSMLGTPAGQTATTGTDN